jgi:tagaturonate reductase
LAQVTPILQFGTSRFLQAHVDLFVAEALPRGEATGRITVVQTTDSPDSARRIAAFNTGPFPIQIRGFRDGQRVEEDVSVGSVARAFSTARDWAAIEAIFVTEARAIVSNTGDRGYEPHPADKAGPEAARSFPAKLARLLLARYRNGAQPLELYPCELITSNGVALREAVLLAASPWGLEDGFGDWLQTHCRWVNSLVDRIVSTPLEPLGAVAEPYALWAIEGAPGWQPFVRHPDIVVTHDLKRYERLKLFILNLGHSVLTEGWLAGGGAGDPTVRERIAEIAPRAILDAIYDEEVLPVFAALGMGEEAAAYRATTLERFANPFLDHKLRDIATNHAAKIGRRLPPLIALAEANAPGLSQPRLRAIAALYP